MATPTHISHSDLMDALQPLFDLLDVTKDSIYANPGITIGHGCVSFNVVVPADSEDAQKACPAGVKAQSHPNNEYGELSYYVEVEVDAWS